MSRNYVDDRFTEENWNINDKYSETGESEFSRDSTVPFDQDEVLSERHYTFGPLEDHARRKMRSAPLSNPFSQSFSGKGPRGYKRSDETIREDVSEALYRSSEVDASEIEVFVSEGEVKLKGTVSDRDQKKMAESVIENLAGVRDVFNELHVKNREKKPPPSRYGLTDNITGMN
ncbi:MAG: BON domain-containing protein [Bacteriovoracia bacterium]